MTIPEHLAVCEKATAGSWYVDKTVALGAYGVWKDVYDTDEPMQQICSVFSNNKSDVPREERDANATFIAMARTALPDALRKLAAIEERCNSVVTHASNIGREILAREILTIIEGESP